MEGNTLKKIIDMQRAKKGKGSEAAKKYIEAWDKAEKTGTAAYEEFKKAQELYSKLGKNKVQRVINAAKYDPEKEDQIEKERSKNWKNALNVTDSYTKKDAKKDINWKNKGIGVDDNLDNIKVSPNLSDHDYAVAVTKELNKRAAKNGISPSGKKQIHYDVDTVERYLREYGNLEGAYDIIDRK